MHELSKRHERLKPSDILALDISGDVLATGDVNGLVCVWSLPAGGDSDERDGVDAATTPEPIRHRYTLRGHSDNIITIVLHCHKWNERNGRVLTASDDTTARIWDTETQTCLHVLRHPEVTCNVHPIHEPVYIHGHGLGPGVGEGGGGRCGVGYVDGELGRGDRGACRGGVGATAWGEGGGKGKGGSGGGKGSDVSTGVADSPVPQFRSWNNMLAAYAARDDSQPAFEFDFHRVIVKCAPQVEWPAETNVETHWSWDLRTESLERSFEACCLSDLVIDDRVLAMLIASGSDSGHVLDSMGQGLHEPTREFSVVLRDIDTGELVAKQVLPPFPRSYGGITKFSVCNTPRPGTGSKVWHGLIEFADERHLAEFGCSADGVPFCHVHCLSPHARFCSLGCPNYSFPIGSAQDGDKLYLVTRDVVPGSITDDPSFRGQVALRAFCLEGKNKGELRRIGRAEPLTMPYDSDGTVNLVAAEVPDPALVSKLSLVMVDKDGALRVWTLPDGQVSEPLPCRLKLSLGLTLQEAITEFLETAETDAWQNVDNQPIPHLLQHYLMLPSQAPVHHPNQPQQPPPQPLVMEEEESAQSQTAQPTQPIEPQPVVAPLAAGPLTHLVGDDIVNLVSSHIEVVICHSNWRWLVALDYGGIQVFDFVEECGGRG